MKLKTTNIKGKEYVEVNERIRAFRTMPQFKNFRLVTSVIEINSDKAIMEAQVLDPEGNIVANGHALELKNSGMVNKTSHIENCETSAWGRALGNLGIGVTTSIASAEEVENAIKQQEALKERDGFLSQLRKDIASITDNFKNKEEMTLVLKTLKIKSFEEIKDFSTQEICEAIIELEVND